MSLDLRNHSMSTPFLTGQMGHVSLEPLVVYYAARELEWDAFEVFYNTYKRDKLTRVDSRRKSSGLLSKGSSLLCSLNDFVYCTCSDFLG